MKIQYEFRLQENTLANVIKEDEAKALNKVMDWANNLPSDETSEEIQVTKRR